MSFSVLKLFRKMSSFVLEISGIFLQYLVDVSWSIVSLPYCMRDFRCCVPFFLQVQVIMSVSWLVLCVVCRT